MPSKVARGVQSVNEPINSTCLVDLMKGRSAFVEVVVITAVMYCQVVDLASKAAADLLF